MHLIGSYVNNLVKMHSKNTDKCTELYILKRRDERSSRCCRHSAVQKVPGFQTATIFHKLLRSQRKISPDNIFCREIAPCSSNSRKHNTTVEIFYYHPSSCHRSSIFQPANTMTFLLRQLGNVLVITLEITSSPNPVH